MLGSYLWSTVLIEFLFDIHGQHLASKRKTFCLFNHLLIGWYCIVTHYHVTLKWKRNYCSKANEWSVSVNREHDTIPHVCCTPIHCTGTKTFTHQENIGGTTTFRQKTVTQLLFDGTYSTRNRLTLNRQEPCQSCSPVLVTAPILVLLFHFESKFARDGLQSCLRAQLGTITGLHHQAQPNNIS